MRMYITRHGQTDWNINHRLQGRTDIPLNALGKAQAVTCGEALQGVGIELIITSPLSRAYETAEIIRGYIGDVSIICDELSPSIFFKIISLYVVTPLRISTSILTLW